MSEVKNMNVVITDEDHVDINNLQFISLKRSCEERNEVEEDLKIEEDKSDE